MTTVTSIEELFGYSYWANRKLFAAIAQLTDAQFTQNVAGSYGSVRNTLVHVMSAEWGWIDRCGGTPRGPKLNPEDYPTAQSLIAQWTKVEGYVRDFLSGLSDADLSRNITHPFGGPDQSIQMAHVLQHIIVHGSHHRGQVALLLRTLGSPAENFDVIFYYSEQGR
jgi:uncharacterized damage-inducible protein DinB